MDAGSVVHLDTHVVVWLYHDPAGRLPDSVKARLADARLAVSPVVRLELQYLREVGRLLVEPDEVLGSLAQSVGLAVDRTPLAAVVEAAMGLGWTRDPFDRMIVAQAQAAGARLATADRKILGSWDGAFWKPDRA